MRTEDVVKLVAGLAGDVIVVDGLSLMKEGPVRVGIIARKLAKT